jgi:hypothetical protein
MPADELFISLMLEEVALERNADSMNCIRMFLLVANSCIIYQPKKKLEPRLQHRHS